MESLNEKYGTQFIDALPYADEPMDQYEKQVDALIRSEMKICQFVFFFFVTLQETFQCFGVVASRIAFERWLEGFVPSVPGLAGSMLGS